MKSFGALFMYAAQFTGEVTDENIAMQKAEFANTAGTGEPVCELIHKGLLLTLMNRENMLHSTPEEAGSKLYDLDQQ